MFIMYAVFVISIINYYSKSEKLIFSLIHFRHGARAPIKLNENGEDLLGIKWSTPGELTAIGKRMEFLLGLRNRQRYITDKYKFLSDTYDPHELIVYSSDVNRTLLSATSQIQGFYPMYSEKGDILLPEQLNIAVPPINISFDEIEKEVNSLNMSALPNFMTIIPIHFIDFKINSSIECATKINNLRLENINGMESILNLVEEFNKNYSEKLNIFYNKTKENKYNFTFISTFCDDTIADITEGKNISDILEKTNIDKNELIQNCYNILRINFRDRYFGGEKNELILYYNSLLLKKMLNYMERRIDDDIKGEISKKNNSDYSRPKMVILSGHDTTLSSQEMFFIKYFNLELESFIFPRYASQISFEITRDDVEDENSRKNLKYSDYKVYYYFNDKLILNITFDKFIENIINNIWDNEKVSNFCSEAQKEFLEMNIIIIIIMGILILILLIVIIVLIIKIKKKSLKDEELISGDKVINDEED